MGSLNVFSYGGALALLMGCAGSTQPTQAPDDAVPEEEPWAAIAPEEPPPSSQTEASSEEAGESESESENTPEFRPGMSVAEARNAVPDTIERLNIEQEALAAPLMKPELYEPCGLAGHHHFTLNVAVWDGRAVGVDVTTQPNDEKLESCLRKQISEVEWREKAKSINTVEYSY